MLTAFFKKNFVWIAFSFLLVLSTAAHAAFRDFNYTFPNGNTLHYAINENGKDQVIFSDPTSGKDSVLLEDLALLFVTADPTKGIKESSQSRVEIPGTEREFSVLGQSHRQIVVVGTEHDGYFWISQEGEIVNGPATLEVTAHRAEWRMQLKEFKGMQYAVMLDMTPAQNYSGHFLHEAIIVRGDDAIAQYSSFTIPQDEHPALPFAIQVRDTTTQISTATQALHTIQEGSWRYAGVLPNPPRELPRVASAARPGLSASAAAAMRRVDQFEQTARSRVIQQPEALGIAVDSERRRAINGGAANKPEILAYAMGQPGTGKDTFAEGIVDALWQKPGAYHDHLFTPAPIQNNAEVWTMLGSATGHVGSENQTPFIHFLVAHSGGKYLIHQERGPNGKKGEESVVLNPEWTGPGSVPGAVEPSMGVVFLNEFHNWDKDAKDVVVKQGLEKGRFFIKNPNGGEISIEVPIRFILASNEGIGLIGSREVDGTRYGPPLSFEQSHERWELVHLDKKRLKEEIWRTNSVDTDKSPNGGNRGISEELLNRIPDDRVVLLEPQSPETKRTIAEIKLKTLKGYLGAGTGEFGPIHIKWTPGLVLYVQEFQDVAEDNSRPLDSKIESLIEKSLYSAIWEGHATPGENVTLELDIARNENGTANLVIHATGGAKSEPVSVLLTRSLVEKAPEPLTDAELDELFKLDADLQTRVVGNRQVLARVARRVIVSEEGRRAVRSLNDATEPAQSFMFLGPSSTGKTETGKAIARSRYKDERAFKTFKFGEVRSMEDLKEKILGKKVNGKPVASEFMKEFDRRNGRFVALFDEMEKTPTEILDGLLDIFREPVVTFADGRDRPMSGVLAIVTGNVGKEWYTEIPRGIPEEERQSAMTAIYEKAMEDPDYQRVTVERHFSAALVNRVGMNNIFFYAPLSFKDIRELSSMKISQAFTRLKPTAGKRGWFFSFTGRAELTGFLDVVDREAFVIDEQGASIDRFVTQDIEEALRYQLMESKIPNGARIRIEAVPAIDETPTSKGVAAYLKLHVEGRAEPVILKFNLRERQKTVPISITGQWVTAYHEVGHELVRRVLLGDYFKPKRISILPGVDKFGDRWLRYLGVAEHEQVMGVESTREKFVREMAVLVGGAEAEAWVTVGDVTGAGKSNDMERATEIAEKLILRFGLSPKWGWQSIPAGMPPEQYKATLPADRQALLASETQVLVAEARALARAVIRENEFAFLPMGKLLAEKGDVDGIEIQAFYDKLGQALVTNVQASMADRWATSQTRARINGAVRSVFGNRQWLEPEMKPNVPKPTAIADPNVIHKARVAGARASANLAWSLPLVETRAARCETALLPLAMAKPPKAEAGE